MPLLHLSNIIIVKIIIEIEKQAKAIYSFIYLLKESNLIS